MTGLSAGALAVERAQGAAGGTPGSPGPASAAGIAVRRALAALRGKVAPPRPSAPGAPGGDGRGVAVPLAGLAGLALLAAWGLEEGWIGGRGSAGSLLFAAGFGVSAVFAAASLEPGSSQASRVSPLYAADLVGGCLGALAASLFLIPVLGMGGSAVALVPLALGALVAVPARSRPS
jgi:hypothetical protein